MFKTTVVWANAELEDEMEQPPQQQSEGVPSLLSSLPDIPYAALRGLHLRRCGVVGTNNLPNA